jgi:hypothetical protein
MMRWVLPLLAAGIFAGSPCFAQQAVPREGRPPDARIDGSTAEQAKRKIEAAGWQDVRELRKGYDAVWHALALNDGVRRRVALTPDGVFPEGD